ncbi:MAG: hypothetical protein OXI77_00790 [Chloroflexota bacterium]|nr:hypothetical protein [Chloroflexota bacterium]MDE2911007.1 hypothetical protein [Chloroflexota bacterium]
MDADHIQRHFVAVMAKHLPPSGSTLRLLDLDSLSGRLLAQSRADLDVQHIQPNDHDRIAVAPAAYDAALAYDVKLSGALLQACLTALRPGGRLIALQSRGVVSEDHLRQLRDHGYVRILVEPALDELGVLIRGEKPHTTADTLARIQAAARADADTLDLKRFRGRYIHLLIQRQPNKPVWQMSPREPIAWRAAAFHRESKPSSLLGFSSLPKAVAFMQPAVLGGLIADVNKVGKFSVETAAAQEWNISLNPTPDSLTGETLTFIDIDPVLAEAPDE